MYLLIDFFSDEQHDEQHEAPKSELLEVQLSEEESQGQGSVSVLITLDKFIEKRAKSICLPCSNSVLTMVLLYRK